MSQSQGPAIPPVSVVIPAYNAETTIERAVATVLNQTWPPAEVIVVDDASTDKTAEIVRGMAKADPRVKLIESETNGGQARARNVAFAAATGDWVAIQDADDAWCDTRIERLLATALAHDLDFSADNFLLYDLGADKVTRTGFSIDRGLRWIRPIDAFQQDVKLGAEFGYGLLQPLMRKAFLDAHRIAYLEDMRYGEDMIFLAELLLSGARAMVIPDPLYIYTTRIGEISGAISPHSHSMPRFDRIADAIDGLQAKYATAMTPQLSRAMTKLARRYRAVHQANLAKQARLQGGMAAYARYVARKPEVAVQVVRDRFNRLKGKVRSQIQKLRGETVAPTLPV